MLTSYELTICFLTLIMFTALIIRNLYDNLCELIIYFPTLIDTQIHIEVAQSTQCDITEIRRL